jgi:hypothetical protein
MRIHLAAGVTLLLLTSLGSISGQGNNDPLLIVTDGKYVVKGIGDKGIVRF